MRLMTELRTIRALTSLSLGLVVLLAVEIPALAYPGAPAEVPPPDPSWHAPAVRAASAPAASALEIRRAVRLQAAAEKGAKDEQAAPSKWVPTKAEGAVFVIAGAGLICAGGIFLGVGLADFFPIVSDAGGLITAAVDPLIMIGLGFTLLFTGVAFLVHGIKTLKIVKLNEEATAAAAERWRDPAVGLRSTPRQTVRPIPLFAF